MAKTKPLNEFDEYQAIIDAANTGGDTAMDTGDTPEELTATAEALPGGDEFDEYQAVIDSANASVAPSAQPAAPNMTKQLAGFIEQNVMNPIGLSGAIEGVKKLGSEIYQMPGQVMQDPAAGATALGGGVAAGAGDVIDQILNLGAKSKQGLESLPMGELSPFYPAAVAMDEFQKRVLGGQPSNLRGAVEGIPPVAAASKQVPGAYHLAQGLPTIAATLLTGGEGLAARLGIGAAENLGLGTLSGLNEQVKAKQQMNLGSAVQNALPQAWIGGAAAGLLGRRTKPAQKAEPVIGPPSSPPPPPGAPSISPVVSSGVAIKPVVKTGKPVLTKKQKIESQTGSLRGQIVQMQQKGMGRVKSGPRSYLDLTQQPKPELTRVGQKPRMVRPPEAPKPPAKSKPGPGPRGYLDFSKPKRGPRDYVEYDFNRPQSGPRGYLDLTQKPKPKLSTIKGQKIEPKSPEAPKKPAPGPGPRGYLDFDKPPEAPKVEGVPRISEFTKRIRKGGDLAHSPGVPGFRRVKGAGGQSKNKVELVDGDGNPILNASNKPVSWSWKTLDDALKPKAIPERLIEALNEARSGKRKIEQERPPEPPKKVEAPEPPKAPEPEPPKAPEPEAPKKAEPEYDPQKVENKAKEKLEKLSAKQQSLEKNLDKLERGDVIEKLKRNRETGELEPTEVRAERARNYIEDVKTQRASVEQALERYQQAVSKPTSGSGEFGKAALEGLVEQLKAAGEKAEQFFKEESGQGVVDGGPMAGLGAGLRYMSRMAKKLDLGEEGLTQQWRGFAAKVERNLSTFYHKLKSPEDRAKIAAEVKSAAGLANDFDIIQKLDPAGLSISMSRHRGVLETLMYDAKLPQTIAERDAFAKTRSMSVEEVLGSEDLRKVLSEDQINWLAATKQATDGMVEDVKARYFDDDITPEYKEFLSDYYESLTDHSIKGESRRKTKLEKASRHITNALYDNIVKGNWGIHSIHFWDALVHGGSQLGRHFWKGAADAYSNPTVKNYIRGYKGSGLMKSARSGDAPTILEKTIGGAIERVAAKNKVVAGALKIGQALEGGWLEGEKMHVLRAGALHRIATDMKIKGGAEGLVKKLQSGQLTPEQILEMNVRQASILSDVIGYNPTGILNRNVFQRRVGALAKIVQPFVGMRTVQSRLLYDQWSKAFVSGKVSDLKSAAAMHGMLLATGGSSTVTKLGKVAIKGALGAAALNEVEKHLDAMKLIPNITVSHLTPDMVPALFITLDNASRLVSDIGTFVQQPLNPAVIAKQGARALGSVLGGSVGNVPSVGNMIKAATEADNVRKGYKEAHAFDETALLRSQYSGKALVGKYDAFDALLSFLSPHDLDKTHHAKEAVIHRDRVLEDIGNMYGEVARAKAAKKISAQTEYDWNKISEWAKENFDNQETKDAQKAADAEKERKNKAKADALTH